jgi:hypothetical protein
MRGTKATYRRVNYIQERIPAQKLSMNVEVVAHPGYEAAD